MPKQIGTHRVLGTTGNMTYSKTQDGFQAREKTVVNIDKFKKSDSYARVRENNAHFTEAGKASKVIRNAFIGLIKCSADGRVTSRLVTKLLQVVNSDATSNRGERKVQKGNMQLMHNFEFNKTANLISTMHAPYTITFDRSTGLYTVSIPSFDPLESLSTTSGATHFRLVAAAAETDFENQKWVSDTKVSVDIPLTDAATPEVTLSPKVTAGSQLPQFLVLGIRFFFEEHGKLYPVAKEFNALAIVQVSGV
jgi:hypothetical protein